MTMTAPRIPIQNLYYLLCYAWNRLPQNKLVDVSGVPPPNSRICSLMCCAKASTT